MTRGDRQVSVTVRWGALLCSSLLGSGVLLVTVAKYFSY